MGYFIQACVRNGVILTVRSQGSPVLGFSIADSFDFAVNAEVEGDQVDARSVLAALVLKGQVLSGLPIVAQTVLPGVVGEVTAPIIPDMTFAQTLIGLVAAGWITEAEGDAWSDGTLPVAVTSLIASLPADHRFAARVRAKRPSVVLRSDPLVNALAAAQGRSPAQMDAFFTTYAAI